MSPKELLYIEDALGHEQFFENAMPGYCQQSSRRRIKELCFTACNEA